MGYWSGGYFYFIFITKKKMRKEGFEEISLNIKNNSDVEVSFPLMGTHQYPGSGQINATQRWSFNLATETFIGLTSLIIGIGPVGGVAVNYSFPFTGTSITELADFLSTLGYGYFLVDGTTLYTNSNQYIYDSLQLI